MATAHVGPGVLYIDGERVADLESIIVATEPPRFKLICTCRSGSCPKHPIPWARRVTGDPEIATEPQGPEKVVGAT